MRSIKKILLLIAGALIVVGCTIFTVSMAVLDFNTTELNLTHYETDTYNIDDDFENIDIQETYADIIFAPSNDGKCRIECHTTDRLNHTVAVRDNTLYIESNYRKGLELHVGADFEDTTMTVYLPKATYESLNLKANIGDIDMPDSFHFERATIETDASNIRFHGKAKQSLDITTDLGDIFLDAPEARIITLTTSAGNLSLSNVSEAAKVALTSDLGDIDCHNISCDEFALTSSAGDLTCSNVFTTGLFSITGAMGDITLNHCDGGSMRIQTDAGDISGTIATDKIFLVESELGTVQVPKTTSGATCEISCQMGDIDLAIG